MGLPLPVMGLAAGGALGAAGGALSADSPEQAFGRALAGGLAGASLGGAAHGIGRSALLHGAGYGPKAALEEGFLGDLSVKSIKNYAADSAKAAKSIDAQRAADAADLANNNRFLKLDPAAAAARKRADLRKYHPDGATADKDQYQRVLDEWQHYTAGLPKNKLATDLRKTGSHLEATMNHIIAGIYGTGGHEKVASEGGEHIATLSDLAALMIVESGADTGNLEKVASAHGATLSDLASFDRSGRAMAHYEFSQMEKEASEGNYAPLEAFFSDLDPEVSERDALKAAIRDELARRVR